MSVRHCNAREYPLQARVAVTAGLKANKHYMLGRHCVVCEGPISMYNKHRTCWVHTKVEKFIHRGGRIKDA